MSPETHGSFACRSVKGQTTSTRSSKKRMPEQFTQGGVLCSYRHRSHLQILWRERNSGFKNFCEDDVPNTGAVPDRDPGGVLLLVLVVAAGLPIARRRKSRHKTYDPRCKLSDWSLRESLTSCRPRTNTWRFQGRPPRPVLLRKTPYMGSTEFDKHPVRGVYKYFECYINGGKTWGVCEVYSAKKAKWYPQRS